MADRLAWLRAHPDQAAILYPNESNPGWDWGDWIPYDSRNLRQCSDELLLHIVRMPPSLVGEALWTRSTLGICEHLAQLYREFRRRYQVRATRASLCSGC